MMRSTILCGTVVLTLGLLINAPSHSQVVTLSHDTLSHDAYVVRWQQDVMPITDVSVLGMLVSDQQLREIAKDALELSDDELQNVWFKINCMSDQDQPITDYGATIQVGLEAGWRDSQMRKLFTHEQRAEMRGKVLKAWEENFSAAYRKAAKSRERDWQARIAALREKQMVAEDRAREEREQYSVAERQLDIRQERAAMLRDLDQQRSAYRMKRDEMAARREALESQIKLLEEKDKDGNGARKKSASIVTQYKRALVLAEQRLTALHRRRGDENADRNAVEDQIHEAEIRVMEAQIALEQAVHEMQTDDRQEAMLAELRNANLELMHMTNTVLGIEQRREEVLASENEELDDANAAGVKQARVEYELAERRLMRLNERLADLEDSGENVVAPLTFIRLSD